MRLFRLSSIHFGRLMRMGTNSCSSVQHRLVSIAVVRQT